MKFGRFQPLLGKYASIDFSDGSGMNCLNIQTKEWSEPVLNLAQKYAPDIRQKLGSPAPSENIAGLVKLSSKLMQI